MPDFKPSLTIQCRGEHQFNVAIISRKSTGNHLQILSSAGLRRLIQPFNSLASSTTLVGREVIPTSRCGSRLSPSRKCHTDSMDLHTYT